MSSVPPGQSQPSPQQYQQQQPPPYAYAPPRPTNVLSIISLVLALVSISVGAVITGHIALSQIKRTGEQGHGLAVAGLVIGYVGCAGWILFWGFLIALPLLTALTIGSIGSVGTGYYMSS